MGMMIITALIGIISGIALGYIIQISKINKITANQNEIMRESVQLKTQIEAERSQRDQAIAAEISKSETSLAALRESFAQERQNMIDSHNRENLAIKENYDNQIEAGKVQRDQAIAAEISKSETSLAALRESFALERQNLIAGNERENKTIKENYEKQIEALKESHSIQVVAMQQVAEELKTNFVKIREEAEKRNSDRLNLMKTEFQSLAQEVLESKSGNLQTANRDLIKSILDPLSVNIKEFKESFDNSKISTARAQAQFESTITQMREETMKIGNDAVNLTKALKGNSKTQGDWGEMILETMLEKSGLVKGENYVVQENIKTEDGKNKRPDVIVKFPENRCVVIDSKVSLTAYTKYVESDTDEERNEFLKQHIASVRNHIKELAGKENYFDVVKNSIGVVLMFIPNESSYITAVQNDPNLLDEAGKCHIVIISPSNLILTLKLANGLWQIEKQNKNVEEVIKRAGDMYDKFVKFTESFKKIGDNIEKAKSAYDEGFGQLSSGRGNLVSKMENIRKMGLNPKKRPEQLFLTDTDD